MPTYQAVLFDFFGTLTHSVATRGARTVRPPSCSAAPPTHWPRCWTEPTTSAPAVGSATRRRRLRWVCAQAGVRPSDAAVRAAVASRHRAVRADTWLRADAVPTLAALRQRGLRTGVISDCTHELPAFLPQLPVAPLLDVRVFSVAGGALQAGPGALPDRLPAAGAGPADCLYVGDGGSQELTRRASGPG